MTARSMTFFLPDVPPFERQEDWYLSYVGNIVAPIVEKAPIGRFWCTGYGAIGAGKHAKLSVM